MTLTSGIRCPYCKAEINLEGGGIGESFECEECLTELMILELDPPKVEMVDEEK
mgnify:CR=1 FL=1